MNKGTTGFIQTSFLVICFWPFVSLLPLLHIIWRWFHRSNICQALPPNTHRYISRQHPNEVWLCFHLGWFQTCFFPKEIKKPYFPFLTCYSRKPLNYRWWRWYISNEGGKDRWFRLSVFHDGLDDEHRPSKDDVVGWTKTRLQCMRSLLRLAFAFPSALYSPGGPRVVIDGHGKFIQGMLLLMAETMSPTRWGRFWDSCEVFAELGL